MIRNIALLLFGLLFTLSGTAQTTSLFSFFQTHKIEEIEISGDIKSLIALKYQDTSFAADILVPLNGDTVKLDADLKVRGRYRRRICSFPPIKIDFSKKDLRRHGITDEIDKYKLVTHCDTMPVFQDYIMREYLTYQIWQVLSDNSFRVYPITIQYTDLDKSKIVKKMGFFIENEKELGQRIGLPEYENFLDKDAKLDLTQTYRTTLFMTLIGNDDYDFYQNRNVALYQGDHILAIPYDFDFCGLVNAHYSIPNPNLPAHRVRDRVVMYDYQDPQIWQETREYFLSKQDEIEDLINNAEYLSKSSRKDVRKFVAFFFKHLEKTESLTFHEVIPYK